MAKGRVREREGCGRGEGVGEGRVRENVCIDSVCLLTQRNFCH